MIYVNVRYVVWDDHTENTNKQKAACEVLPPSVDITPFVVCIKYAGIFF